MKLKLAVFTRKAGPKHRHEPWLRVRGCRGYAEGWRIAGLCLLLVAVYRRW